MYNKIFKNYQINVGMPVQIRMPVNLLNTPVIKNDPKFVDDMDGVSCDISEELSKNNIALTQDTIDKAREEAELIIREAQFEAAKIMETAELEADVLKFKLQEEAQRNGYEQGLAEAQKQYENLIAEAELTKKNAEVEYAQALAGMERDIINMVLDISKKVIDAELSANKDNVLQLVRQAFDRCSNKESAVLRVSSQDYDHVVVNKAGLLSMVEGLGDVEIRKDSALKAGGCIIETLYGNIDAGVQTKLGKIEEAFRQVMVK